jgi:hypothetical protein
VNPAAHVSRALGDGTTVALRPLMFSPPFNWCDRRCERCPLTPICAVAHNTIEPRRDLEFTVESFREMSNLIDQIARDQGIDPDTVVCERPALAERAKRIIAILDASPDFAALSTDAVVVRMKIGRLQGHLDDPQGEEIYVFDTVPNLLLLELLIERLHPLTAAALREELSPLFAAIDPALRRVFDTLIETGLAPSPFCIEEPANDRAAS